MQETEEQRQEKRTMYEAFHSEQGAEIQAFRDYWQKESEPARIAKSAITDVISGKTAISNAAVETCRLAVMRLHQIAYVLGELSCYVGSPRPAVHAVLDIVARANADAADAKKNLQTILGWVAAATSDLDGR